MIDQDTNTVLVSIGLPVVKCDFLAQAIESCLSQSYRHFEVLLVNNGKTDVIRREIKNVFQTFSDPRLHYFENEEQLPMIKNWNKVLSYASGEYFAIQSDDDFWHPDFIKELVLLSGRYPKVNVLHARVLVVDDKNVPIKLSTNCPEYEDFLDFVYNRIRGFRDQYLSDFMVKTSALKQIGGFFDLPNGWGSDDITWFKLAKDAGIAYTPKILYHYRDSGVTTTNTTLPALKDEATKRYTKTVEEMINANEAIDDLHRFRLNIVMQELVLYATRRKYQHQVEFLRAKYKNYQFWRDVVLL